LSKLENPYAGIPAACVNGTMSNRQRQAVYVGLKKGEIQVITSVATLTEGYDEPSLECVILARPTLSQALYMQMVGRGIRLCPDIGKTDCLVYDFGTGNVERFGRIDEPIEISLENLNVDENPAEVINCPKCGACTSTRTRICSECRTILIEPKEDDELEPFDDVPDEAASEQLSEEEIEQCRIYRQHLREAYQQGYKPGWAIIKFREQYGIYPPAWWGQGAVFGSNPTPTKQEQYTTHIKQLATKHGEIEPWVDRHLELEFGQGFNVPSLALIG